MTLLKKWQFVFSDTAEKQFSKFDKPIQKQIISGIEKIVSSPNPKSLSTQLKGTKQQFFRFRIGDYRIIVRFKDKELVILALKIGHRRLIYK
jgi:mRNA interferase RelE/StbE